MDRLGNRMQVLPGMMKIERLEGILEAILRQIPQPHRSIHDQIDHLRPGQSPAQCFPMRNAGLSRQKPPPDGTNLSWRRGPDPPGLQPT